MDCFVVDALVARVGEDEGDEVEAGEDVDVERAVAVDAVVAVPDVDPALRLSGSNSCACAVVIAPAVLCFAGPLPNSLLLAFGSVRAADLVGAGGRAAVVMTGGTVSAADVFGARS